MPRTYTFAASTLTAAALIALASPVSRATVSGNYASSTNFSFTVTWMPDFDQVRAPGPGVGGLPNDGRMYCVPTSALNLCAYIANHGYPFLSPGPGNWASQARYNQATGQIFNMGALMFTSPTGGTGGTNGYNGLQWYIANPFIFDVDRYYASGFYAPTTSTIGQVWLNGGVANFCYGRYEHSGNVLTERKGGHCVTATKVAKSGLNSSMRYRDPASGGDSEQTQSQFTHTTISAVDKVFLRDGNIRVMSELITSATDGRLRIIDSVYAIYPIAGLTDSPEGLTFFRPFPLSGYMPPPQFIEFNPALIQDIVQSPDNTEVFVLAQAIPGAKPGALHRIDPVTNDDTVIDLGFALNNPHAMKPNRHQELYIIDGRTVICVDTKSEVEPATVLLPEPGYEALATDSGDDCLMVIKEGAPAQILKYPRNLQGDPQVISLPGNIPLFGKIWFDCCPEDKSLWLCSEKDDKLYQAVIDPASGRYILGATISGDDIVNPRCINLRRCDQLIFACDDSVKEFRKNRDGVWEEATDGPFARGGFIPGQCFHVSRSDTNFDPEIHNTEFDEDILPEELMEGDGEVADCPGDMDQDDDIDLDDLQLFLFEFGLEGFWRSGDLNQDGIVDLNDLQLMLFAFGTRCN